MKKIIYFTAPLWIAACLLSFNIANATVSVTTTGQTLQPTCFSITKDLSYGSSDYRQGGNDVTHLQQFLIEQNLLDSTLATGFFGSITRSAVVQYQLAKNISPAVGYVGPLTRNSIATQSCNGAIALSPITQPISPFNNDPFSIDRFSAYSGSIGTAITVQGSGFDRYSNSIIFGNKIISNIPSSDGSSIVFLVPDITASCPTYSSSGCNVDQNLAPKNEYQIYISNARKVSDPIKFKVTSGITYIGDDGISISKKTPTFNDIGAPTVLSTNAQGVWLISVHDSYSSPVTATVDWGDGLNSSKTFTLLGDQTLTFTHTYTTIGTYHLHFGILNDSSGRGDNWDKDVKVTASVVNAENKITVNGLVPDNAKVGTSIMIIGQGFSSSGNSVRFGAGIIKNLSSYNNGRAIIFTVPSSVNPCDIVNSTNCALPMVQITPGDYVLSVSNAAGLQSSSRNFGVNK